MPALEMKSRVVGLFELTMKGCDEGRGAAHCLVYKVTGGRIVAVRNARWLRVKIFLY